MSITSVKLYSGTTLLDTDSSGSGTFEFIATAGSEGVTYKAYHVVVTDSGGTTGESAVKHVKFNDATVPVVASAAQHTDSEVEITVTVTLDQLTSTSANPAFESVKEITLYRALSGGTTTSVSWTPILGDYSSTVSSSTWTHVFNQTLADGKYSLTAKWKDGMNEYSAASAAVNINVDNVDPVNIPEFTAPANNYLSISEAFVIEGSLLIEEPGGHS